RHHRNNKDLVLNRLAFKNNIQIIGGASKLIKNSQKILKEDIITWSDNRWSNGNVYESAGFELEEILGIDYSYTRGNEKNGRRSKQSMQKKRISCPDNITEHEYC